ncbi:uncharacterized protein DUF4426 [Idiomarina fontislapidosi]|uniref:DUF4426 domain-containing protein n=1 Tax=Idiomarina fontislapidosi TaxID=263723 RepID=A0A432XUZ8_9GAMM|nr:DUF4426 domain-containing protein [Idiomarina fontislapidosi]PYE31843.1 uncharacterized protein DUF4426 [Idiomarina fontislapidosi]RUO52483.1 DUF4426 domain-containing protein [Idiomarina fontislapidosi]|tara:strand:+ start:5481 stop:5921 length:441 start_codon:yes stop_codon:yes gene_type:complete
MQQLSRYLTFTLLLAASTFSGASLAEQKQQLGGWDVHYNAFNSTFLTAEIASTYDIQRSEKTGLINIAVLNSADQQAVAANLKGHVINPRGGVQTLDFQKIDEGKSIYYIADFLFGDEELMRFKIDISDGAGKSHRLEFEQQLYQE